MILWTIILLVLIGVGLGIWRNLVKRNKEVDAYNADLKERGRLDYYNKEKRVSFDRLWVFMVVSGILWLLPTLIGTAYVWSEAVGGGQQGRQGRGQA